MNNVRYREMKIEGRNAVTEALKSKRPVDSIVMIKSSGEKPDERLSGIISMAERRRIPVSFESREFLDSCSETGKHQGVIALCASYSYAQVSDLLKAAREKNEPPFFIILDKITDPHNLGAVIRTANVSGAHGVIVPKNNSAPLSGVVAKASAGAVNYTPVAAVTNLSKTIEDLKKEGMWFVCADMDGECMYDLNLTGSVGLVIGSEGKGVSRLVREKCDFVASIPMFGQINSLNASVACGVMAYEIVRQRLKS